MNAERGQWTRNHGVIARDRWVAAGEQEGDLGKQIA